MRTARNEALARHSAIANASACILVRRVQLFLRCQKRGLLVRWVYQTNRLTEETMTFNDFLLHLFYLVDSELAAMNLSPLRQRGHRPSLHDSEVITIEVAGEFLG